MDDIRKRIVNFIGQNLLPEGDGTDLLAVADLKAAAILDSLSTLKLIAFLEDDFRIELGDADLVEEHFSNVESIAQLIARRSG